MRPPVRRLHDLDRQLFRQAALSKAGPLDEILPRLTRFADHGVLWMTTAAVLAATGAKGRRAATRGLVSVGVASALSNGPLKWIARRQRPALTDVPAVRLLTRQPGTTSFPSGHSASAAAFATGVALQLPAVGAPIGVVAAAVIYSRVFTGVHYPSDVIVGAAIGSGAALVVRRVWPVHPDGREPAQAEPAEAPALPDGRGLVVVVNAAAGSANADVVRAEVQELLPAAEVVACEDPDDLGQTFKDAAGRAQVLGVAGGDGTVNCAAAAALEAGVPLAVLPAGTLNHFTADLGVADIAAVATAVRSGSAVEIAVGSAAPDGNDLYFLNTFSLGLYPELVRRRERRERWLGKWLALSVALAEVLRHATPTEIEVDGSPRRLWLMFAGNGHYHPDGFAPSWRDRLDDPRIDVRIVDADHPWARVRLVAAVLSGRLGRCRVYEERLVDRLQVSGAASQRLARDGEAHKAPGTLTLQAARRRLVVYRPAT